MMMAMATPAMLPMPMRAPTPTQKASEDVTALALVFLDPKSESLRDSTKWVNWTPLELNVR